MSNHRESPELSELELSKPVEIKYCFHYNLKLYSLSNSQIFQKAIAFFSTCIDGLKEVTIPVTGVSEFPALKTFTVDSTTLRSLGAFSNQ